MKRASRPVDEVVAADDVVASSNRTMLGEPIQPRWPSAWTVWSALSTMETATMAASEADRFRMIERHRLVVSIIEINSQQLRCEGTKAGVDIERACAQREASLPGASEELKTQVAVLEQRLADLNSEAQRLEMQREFLNSSLAEFDRSASSAEAVEALTVGNA